ncbi:hypothetical protein DFH09DRAFT_1170472 [Mycena vulgaris]|nr:hypothetical protein DFH09DRAFT_1170472 [Mycena vulgaris]
MRAEYSRRDCDADVGPLLATSMHPSWAAGDLWLPRSSSRSGGHLAPMLSEGTRTVTSPCPHVHGVRLHASTPARKPSPEVGASSNCVGASLRRDRRFVARASSSPSPPIRARYRDRTVPLRMRSADVMCVLVHHGDDLGRSRRSEVLRGMRRSLGLRAGEDGRGASVAHERDGWGCGDSGTRGIREDGGDPWIPRCFAHARLPHEPHFLEAHDIIADRDHLAARRAHLFRSRRRRHERHVLLKRLLIAGTSVSFSIARSWYQR